MDTFRVLICVISLLACVSWGVRGQQLECPTSSPLKCSCVINFNTMHSLTCADLGNLSLAEYERKPLFKFSDATIMVVRFTGTRIKRIQSFTFEGLKARTVYLNNMGIEVVDNRAFGGDRIAASLKNLYLQENDIVSLPDGVFNELKQLTFLKLYKNKLLRIGLYHFAGLTNLYQLSLHNNEISEISTGAFQDLQKLVTLELDHNQLPAIDEGLYSDIANLKTLQLHYNRITTAVNTSLLTLGQLEKLTLNANGLETLPKFLLQDCAKLEHLDLSENYLEEIPLGFLYHTPLLEYLDASFNKIKSMHQATLGNLNKLLKLHLHHNELSDVPELSFEDLRLVNEVTLNDNKLTTFTSNNFAGLTKVKSLHLQRNQIEGLTFGLFDPMGLIAELDLSHNAIRVIEYGIFDANRALQTLDLSHNRIENIFVVDQWFRKASQLQTLKLQHNKIRYIEPGSLDALVELTEMYLHNNWLQEVQETTFSTNHKLRTLTLSANPLWLLKPLSLKGLAACEHLELNNTCLGMDQLPPSLFSQTPALVRLYLQDTWISAIPAEFTRGLSELREFNAARNNITQIGARVFENNAELRTLQLAQNQIADLSFISGSGRLVNLETLDLSYNQVGVFLRSYIDDKLRMSAVRLAGNPMDCGCESVWLRHSLMLKDEPVCATPPSSENAYVRCYQPFYPCPTAAGSADPHPVCANLTAVFSPEARPPPPETVDPGVCDMSRYTTTTTSTSTTTTPPTSTISSFDLVTLEVTATSFRSLGARWSAKDTSNIRAWILSHRPFGSSNATEIRFNDTAIGEFAITGLEPENNYVVCVETVMFSGRGNRDCVEILTLPLAMAKPGAGQTPGGATDKIPLIAITSVIAFILIFVTIIVISYICYRRNKKPSIRESYGSDDDHLQIKSEMLMNGFTFSNVLEEDVPELATVTMDPLEIEDHMVDKMSMLSNGRLSQASNGGVVHKSPNFTAGALNGFGLRGDTSSRSSYAGSFIEGLSLAGKEGKSRKKSSSIADYKIRRSNSEQVRSECY